MNKIILPICLAFISTAYGKPTNWIQQSNAIAEKFTLDLSALVPEMGSSLGYRQFDTRGSVPTVEWEEKQMEFNLKWIEAIDREEKATQSADVSLDLKVLRESLERDIEALKLDRRYAALPVEKVAKNVFDSLQMLINPQSDSERKKSALSRFKVYVNGDGQNPGIALGQKKRIQFYLEKYKTQKILFPLDSSIQEYLAQSDAMLAGTKELLESTQETSWKQDFETYRKDLLDYNNFLKEEVLPKCRKTPQLPLEMYNLTLRGVGIQDPAEALIKTAKKDFDTVFQEFKKLALKVSKEKKMKVTEPHKVIAELKKNQITKPDDILKLFQDADKVLAEIIQKHQLATLPSSPLKIRIAGDAESKSSPVPHLIPPPLVNNKGERPEFVVPSSSSGKLPFDDFSFAEAAFGLLAHEGRPGHDLHFSSMLDNGVSIIRARYAFNNVNPEGWALWAEDLVMPYLPAESQLITLQMRLWRIARMFLDPQVNTGKTNEKTVFRTFTEKLGVSPEMAKLEYNRYAYRNPGQAGSYYYGLLEIRKAHSLAKKKHGKKFNLKCFNDSVLAQGLLPVRLTQESIVKGSDCTPI